MENTLLNLIPAAYLPEIHLSQYDVGRTITFTLKDGASDYSVPSGASVKVKATKPSGFGFEVACTFNGGTVTLVTTDTMTPENGRFPAELSIVSGNTTIGTSNFIFNIERSPHPEGTIDGDAESLLPELTLLVERVESAASSVLDMQVVANTLPSGSQATYSYDESLNKATFGIPQGEPGAGAVGTVASAYDASKTYAVGDYAIHNNDLYRCITAITTAEAFTASHWTKIVLADDVTDLKSDLDSIGDFNLFNSSAVTLDKVISANGTVSNFDGGAYTGLIPVSQGDYLLKFKITNPTGQGNVRIHSYNGSDVWQEQLMVFITPPFTYSLAYKISIPNGVDHIKISFPLYSKQSDTSISKYNGGMGVSAIDGEARNTADLVFNSIKNVEADRVLTTAMFSRRAGITPVLTSGYIQTNGTTGSQSSAGYTPIFEVEEDEVLTIKKYYLSGGVLKGGSAGYFGTIVYFDENQNYLSWGKNWNADSLSEVVPKGAKYAQATIQGMYGGTYTDAMIVRTLPNGNSKYVLRQRVNGKPFHYVGELNANEVISLGFENVWTNKGWIFDGLIDEFGTVKIGSCQNGVIVRPYIEITSTKVNIYSDLGSASDNSYDHGLTIANDLQIIYTQGRSFFPDKLVVQSNGSRWTFNDNNVRVGTPYYGIGFTSAGSFTNCSLSVALMDINKPVWVFGDSWAVPYDTRWLGQAVNLELDKGFMVNSHAGETSLEALEAFKNLVAVQQPKMVIWCMGMNDEDTNDSTPNADWLKAVEEVMDICSDYDITLLLYTVPSVPASQGDYSGTARNNNAKNAYVVASGYRYVDAVSALGADTDGNWITGYWQSNSDHAHTSEAGAKALMARFFADAPEMLSI